MKTELTLGSLFDGIAGFPLAAVQTGIKPLWASEIEKNCVDITEKNFPEMKQLGDITKIKGKDIHPVDIISFGSPCQNLSVAGDGTGLATNYRRNEVRNKWKIPKVCSLGKCGRGFFKQQRAGFPKSA